MRLKRNAYIKKELGRLDVDGRIILKWMLMKWNVRSGMDLFGSR
jgi:hypothetical protein